MKDQNKKQPFSHSGKYKDAGFKDNIVWESLMHFDGVTDFDKVIFLTKDTDYANCQVEFKAKWNRHISISSDISCCDLETSDVILGRIELHFSCTFNVSESQCSSKLPSEK